MEYRRLGATDLRVSRICFGTFPFGGAWGAVDTDEAVAAIKKAFVLGVNFFDSARAYGFGLAEGLIAAALASEIKSRRDSLVLATKGGLGTEGGRRYRDASPKSLRRDLEESLRRLCTDYLDLYQVHWPDPAAPFEETAAAMEEFVREGKVRYVGVSNYDVAQMEAFRAGRKVDVLQPPYSLFVRDIEDGVLPYCRANRIGVIVYGTMAHGLLAGRIGPSEKFGADDWRSRNHAFLGRNLRLNLDTAERLRQYASARDRTVAQLAVAWTLANPDVDAAIVGARRPGQIEETVGAAEFRLTQNEAQEVARIARGATPLEEPTPETI